MRQNIKVWVASIGAIAMVLTGQAGSADIWKPSGLPQSSATVATTLDEGWRLYGAVSSINLLRADSNEWGAFCEQFKADCAITPSLRAVTNRILPVCSLPNEGNCLEGLAIALSGSPLVQADPLPELSGYRLDPDAALGIPQGSLPRLYTAAGQKFVVNARMVMSIKDGAAIAEDLQVQVWRVIDKVDSSKQDVEFVAPNSQNPKGSVEGGWDVKCAVAAQDYCAEIVDFEPGTVIQTTIRVTDQVTGWLKGRLTSPEITSTKVGQFNRYVIQGEAVKVPKLYAEVPKSHPLLQNADGISGVTSGSLFYQTARADSTTGVSFVTGFSELSKDTAAASQSLWYVSTIGDSWELSRCNANKEFIGLVTTNAMAFDGDIPKFQSGYLSYNVAGMHFEADGKTEVLGSYDLAIKSSVARCLYGYSNAPVSAQISVTGTGGEQKVATTIVREAKGWLTLSAKGFTFSQNQIKVELRQAKTFAVAKFAGASSKLSKAQSAVITNTAQAFGDIQSAKCTVFYKSPKDRSLALQRAASVCSLIKNTSGRAILTQVAKATSATASVGKVSITLN